MFDAMNVVYQREARFCGAEPSLSLGFTLRAIVFLLLALAAIIVVPVVLNYIGFPSDGEQALSLLRWPILFVITLFALAVIYRFGPALGGRSGGGTQRPASFSSPVAIRFGAIFLVCGQLRQL
jgi:membrane protein